jgi:predicted amidohydrolase YtcJ
MRNQSGRHVLYNARIYTLDEQKPVVSAMVIERGRILQIGDRSSLISQYEESSTLHDLVGKTIIPGLVDAHIHLQHYALSMQRVDCETSTRDECLERVAAQVNGVPTGEWILGHGWNQNEWPEDFGNAHLLDQIAPGNPVYLTAKSLHAAWVNSIALHEAGITSQTPDPPGGQIQRHPDGSPTGILFETAMSLASDILPDSSDEQVSQAIELAQTELWKMGITGAHDFDGRTCFAVLQQLHAAGKLKLRVTKSIPIESLTQAVELGLRTGFGDDFLRIGSVKAFADGALGPRTAAMLQSYEGEPENRGLLMLDAEELFERGSKAVENGLSLAVHAIGDSANHEVLQAYQQLRIYERNQVSTNSAHGKASYLRHRIEHVQIIHPDDISRLAELDVIASMQPIHVTSDFPTADRYWGVRSKSAYAWNSLAEAGTLLAFGSDAPVESPNPFWGLHAAVTRRRADGSPGPQGWYPEQRISLLRALQGFTSGAAYAAGMENRLGKLIPGFLADLLVLDQDIFKIDPEKIRDIRPLGTMIAGDWVYLTPQLEQITSTS